MNKSQKTDGKALKKFVARVGEHMPLMLDLMEADIRAHKGTLNFGKFNELKRSILFFEINNTPITLKDLAINGNDLLELGFKGKKIGEALNKALDLVLDDDSLNIKEILLKLIIEENN